MKQTKGKKKKKIKGDFLDSPNFAKRHKMGWELYGVKIHFFQNVRSRNDETLTRKKSPDRTLIRQCASIFPPNLVNLSW